MGEKANSSDSIGALDQLPLILMWNEGKGCVGCGAGCTDGDDDGGRHSYRVINGLTTAAVANGSPFGLVLLLIECDQNKGGAFKLVKGGGGGG